jgi:hypothetical protein
VSSDGTGEQQFSSTPRYLPYNPSDYDKTRQLSSDNTIVIWHETDTTPSNTIQESDYGGRIKSKKKKKHKHKRRHHIDKFDISTVHDDLGMSVQT